MASTVSDSTPSLTPSRSPSPTFPVQPDHFYSPENNPLSQPSTPSSGRSWLSPDDDPMATRGIPVFKPTMDEFRDFEAFMNSVESWGMHSGIIKVIPPKEWTESLPSIAPQLAKVRIKKPIEQHMFGRAGLFRQENIEKRNLMSVREWAELCSKDDFMAPGVDDVALKATGDRLIPKKKKSKKGTTVKEHPDPCEPEPAFPLVKEEDLEEDMPNVAVMDEVDEHIHTARNASPVEGSPTTSTLADTADETQKVDPDKDCELHTGRKRRCQTRAGREAAMAKRDALNTEYMKDFDPHGSWLPPNTHPSDYTPEFCAILERRYWRNCGLGKPPWYGADSEGSLFTDETTSWNVARLPSTLSRLIPSSDNGLPGVNMPYLYFGMWRATFAWHVEDMDLFSINYIHFGAPKHWYAIPQGRAQQLENTMRSFFPQDTSKCRQFLRHKSFLASPNLLNSSACKPNVLVQRAGEFVITYPRGYHAGFNLGFNCAESINFALESWLEIGRKAQVCGCVGDSVRIDVDELLRAKEEREREAAAELSRRSSKKAESKTSRKRKLLASSEGSPRKGTKKPKVIAETPVTKPTVLLKFSMPKDLQPFPCCLCTSREEAGLLPVNGIPSISSGHSNHLSRGEDGAELWRAHESCALIVPETWVDEVFNVSDPSPSSASSKRMVFGVDTISKDRWHLKCVVCQKARHKSHGAPIQCTKGKCPKAFHISCAKEDPEGRINFAELRDVFKDVVVHDEQRSLIHSRTSALSSVMDVEGSCDLNAVFPAGEPSSAQNIKRVRKIEFELLCSQHNPVVAAAKKASKQDKIRSDLLKLPEMARIKLRVSSGVFEVSLVRVIEDRNAVEVLWDGGVRREFSWNSVVWGKTTEGQQVGQKPSVMAEQHIPKTEPPIGKTPNPAITLSVPRSGPAASSSTLDPGHNQMASSSAASPAAYPLSAYHSTSNGHSYPHAFTTTHAPYYPPNHHHANGNSMFQPYPLAASSLTSLLQTNQPAPAAPHHPYGHGSGSGSYSYYSTYGQPYLYPQGSAPSSYYAPGSTSNQNSRMPMTQLQPYGFGAQAYPVLTVPLRPQQPSIVTGGSNVSTENNASDAGNGNTKKKYSTFHVTNPASLAVRYGHSDASSSSTKIEDNQDMRPVSAESASMPITEIPLVGSKTSEAVSHTASVLIPATVPPTFWPSSSDATAQHSQPVFPTTLNPSSSGIRDAANVSEAQSRSAGALLPGHSPL